MNQLNIVIIGMSITSSWGNGHATTYRGLVRGLAARGHRILFLEQDQFWYRENRDQPQPEGATTLIYEDSADLMRRYEREVRDADLVIMGSFVTNGISVGAWVTATARGTTAFYDIDTPVTFAQIREGVCEYLTPSLISAFDLYLSFTGGPLLRAIETDYGSTMARVLYCSVDPDQYRPLPLDATWDLGYLGTYSDDRQPGLEALLLEPARAWTGGRFAVVGAMYPPEIQWPENVDVQIHLAPREHPAFYGAQRFTLNITREQMRAMGYSPSVRLFEAGSCATPVISDWWMGLDELFQPGRDILIAENAEQSLRYLRDVTDDARRNIGLAARQRVLAEHTPAHRAIQLERYLKECHDNAAPDTPRRNGRSGKSSRGPETRLAAQPGGPPPGAVASRPVGSSSIGRHLYQPARTSRRDSDSSGQPDSGGL